MAKNRIKLIRNKEGQGGPQYSVTYKVNLRNGVNYAILNALAGDRDVVLTMNTDLMFGAEGKEKRLFEEFMDRVKAKGLAYRERVVPSTKDFAIFGFVLNRTKKKKQDAQEAAVYIPRAVWGAADFAPFLPTWGAQYYMAKAPMDERETVDRVLDMTDEERAEVFAMDVYDVTVLGQIGLNARDMEEEDIKRALDAL